MNSVQWNAPIDRYKEECRWGTVKKEQQYVNNVKRFKFNPVKRTDAPGGVKNKFQSFDHAEQMKKKDKE